MATQKNVTDVPANTRCYRGGVRFKEFEHAHGMLAAMAYPARIARHERDLVEAQETAAQYPDMEYFASRVTAIKRALSRARSEYQRALAWESRRDAAEAAGTPLY